MRSVVSVCEEVEAKLRSVMSDATGFVVLAVLTRFASRADKDINEGCQLVVHRRNARCVVPLSGRRLPDSAFVDNSIRRATYHSSQRSQLMIERRERKCEEVSFVRSVK